MFEEKIEMDFRLSPKTLSLLEEDEFDWTPPESKKTPTFAIFTPSTYEVRIKSKKPQVPLLKNLSLNKNRLHVKNLEFKTRLLHIYIEIDSLFDVRKYNKVHIFWEGHKILLNLHLTFDWHYISTKVRWRFRKILWPSQNI